MLTLPERTDYITHKLGGLDRNAKLLSVEGQASRFLKLAQYGRPCQAGVRRIHRS